MKRPQKIRKQKDTILIVTNGKKTEKNYFELISKRYHSLYTIEIKFLGGECDKLVNFAISVDKSKYNQVWCVFDIDDSLKEKHLIYALKLAEKNNINIAYSNESFEVWLLYHLSENVSSSLIIKLYIKEINKLLSNKGCLAKYQKGDSVLLEKQFIPNLLIATENAKKTHQKFEANHQKSFSGNKGYPIWDWKSTTNIYQLIERLKLTDREQ